MSLDILTSYWQNSNMEDLKGHAIVLRITHHFLKEMVKTLTPYLETHITFMREPLGVSHKLATTLHFLATGNTYASLQYGFRVDEITISNLLPEVCKAIIDTYKVKVLMCPKQCFWSVVMSLELTTSFPPWRKNVPFWRNWLILFSVFH